MKEKKDRTHVLVIDDDDFLLNSIGKKLNLNGYKATVSNNVHDAYFKLSILRPDLILLDIIMPEMNGIEFMKLINARFNPGRISPIVLMSHLPQRELYDMGYSTENAYFLGKPFSINHLPFILEKIFLRHKANIELIDH